MSLAPGTRLGPYDVLAALGAGGMGEVYRATDTKLNRDVALKVLPDAFAQDAERMARFQREAHVLASLNHPNIAAIYGLEEADDTRALVLELVEGPTLTDRIAQGPIPVDEALPIAKQIAEALEAAHEQGIIHRDLKPANIKLRPDGTVKVLDFGLAKALEGEQAQGDQANSPTLTAAASQMGVIMGTAAYMSPEQARGKAADRRADIWAFGVVLYEMLTGQRAFEGEDVSLTLAEVMKSAPAWELLPSDTTPALRTILTRCLQKEARQRVQAVGDVRLAMEGAFESAGSRVPDANHALDPRTLWQRPLPALGATLLLMALTGLAVWSFTQIPAAGPVVRYSVRLPDGEVVTNGGGIALSPDGERLVYASTRDGVRQLFLRVRNQSEAIPLGDTEGAAFPFFSPDGEWVGFFTETALKKVSLAGGPAVTLCAAGFRFGATWGPNDTIVFASSATPGLMQVSAAGGTPTALTTPADGEEHLWPEFVAASRAVLFTSSLGRTLAGKRIAVVSLNDREQRILVDGTGPRLAPSGHLVFAREASLWAVPFDGERLEVRGEPAPVLEGVQVNLGRNWPHYALADDGSLAYLPGQRSTAGLLVSIGRDGQETVLFNEPRNFDSPRFSPTGNRIAVEVGGDILVEPGIWIVDVARGTLTPFTAAGGGSRPVWTPKGDRLTFRRPDGNIYWQAADGSDEATLLVPSENQIPMTPASWSVEGFLAFNAGLSNPDIWIRSPEGELSEFLATASDESQPRFSPDGRWLAYMSSASGRPEVYVQPYPGPGGRVQISTDGGSEPVWAPLGGELFYRDLGNNLVAVPIVGTSPLSPGQPRLLLRNLGEYRERFDIAPEGDRLVMAQVGQPGVRSEIHMVLNWVNELEQLVPTP